MPFFPMIRRSAMIALLAACAFPALAQDGERWYQVELLIFSHEQASGAEEWDALPQLAYPDAGRFLIYPAQVESRLEEHGGQSEVDEFGRQLITPLPEENGSTSDGTDIPRREEAAPGTVSPDAAPQGDAAAEIEPLFPTPFIVLPRNQREFHGKSAYMQRTGRYRTLFHETWIQPVLPESRALPLFIDQSGDTGTWPRLQGSVKLHISRYLHLETNLWLNTQGDYLPGVWSMPAPPLGPPSLIVELPEPELEEESDPYFVTAEDTYAEQGLTEDGFLEEEDLGPTYPWRHAVLMQQKRRMRSREVHYLDHPLLGVVIQLIPVQEERLQLMAEAEARAAETKPR